MHALELNVDGACGINHFTTINIFTQFNHKILYDSQIEVRLAYRLLYGFFCSHKITAHVLFPNNDEFHNSIKNTITNIAETDTKETTKCWWNEHCTTIKLYCMSK